MRFCWLLVAFGFPGLSILSPRVDAQSFSIGLGVSVNQTWFRQKDTHYTQQREYSNPHKPGTGIGAFADLSFMISKKYLLNLQPGVSVHHTTSDVTSGKQLHFATCGLSIGRQLGSDWIVSASLRYDYLMRMLSRLNERTADLTFFANNRHFLSPGITASYQMHPNLTGFISGDYFLVDLFNSGALDLKGNIVGPIRIFPVTLNLGVTWRTSLKQQFSREF